MAMFLVFLFTLILCPLLLGAISHLYSLLYHRKSHNNLSSLAEPLTLHQNFLLSNVEGKGFSRQEKISTTMDEKHEQKPMRRKISLQNIDVEEVQKAQAQQALMGISSTPSSPFKKSASSRTNCLCSPTTHVGSFRCRLHRNGSNFRRGNSVGSDLSELANKLTANKSAFPTASSLQMH